MSREIRLIGAPGVIDDSEDAYRPRSRKSWALLSYLILSDIAPSRHRLTSLLFSAADDPMRALRWNLSEVRKLIGTNGEVAGNPVVLTLPKDTTVDVNRIINGEWTDALTIISMGSEFLEGLNGVGSPEFELWLLGQRRRLAASIEALMHEATLALLSDGRQEEAISMAEPLVAMNPFDEAHQAALIRSYRAHGDAVSAQRQLEACTQLFAEELGVSPGPAIRAAALYKPVIPKSPTSFAAVTAAIEAGTAAMTAGAPDSGLMSLRVGVALADSLNNLTLRSEARIALADALVHAGWGEDEEGALLLHEAEQIARVSENEDHLARARIELGFIDMLGARYDRAKKWLTLAIADSRDPVHLARARSYLGVVESDRANYRAARDNLDASVENARSVGDARRQAYAVSMLGRIALLTGEIDKATGYLHEAIALGQQENWLAFLPWPQTFLGEALLSSGEIDASSVMLEQAFARACQVGDPCWEGVSGRALALVADARGATKEAFEILADALKRCVRLSDTYRWGEAYILDAQCTLGVMHAHPKVDEWVEALYELASRTGMKELTARSLNHRYCLTGEGDVSALRSLLSGIANPLLDVGAPTNP